MAKHLLPLLCFVAACSPTMPPSMNQCVDDTDCGESLTCSDGTCIAQPVTACRSDETRPCGPAAVGVCHPGVFRCIGGVFETTCFGEVTGSAETCNGIDDDCDGTVDNGVITTFYVDRDGDGFGSSATGAESRQACTQPTGFADNASDCDDTNPNRKPTAQEICDPSDVDENCDGVANEGCSCSNPGMMQACCAGRGFQTCDAFDGGTTLSMCSVQPAPEFCNGIDDDCDGQADELFLVVTDDGGVPMLDAGTILPDGGCTIGVGACARTAGVACVMGSLSCLAVQGAPSAETCNNIDDDCDGLTDEASSGLCPAAGQTCSAGTCACPSGQVVCGASCATLGGSCTNGLGACARTGAIACVSGGPACDAVPGPQAPEACDGIDNDCDGTVDNGVTILCYVDADNDKAALNGVTSAQCPDPSRATTFGSCPVGFVAPSHFTGLDCNDSNAAVYRVANTYADADNDGRCAGQESTECIGANPPAGRRLSATCVSVSDCNDANASFWQLGLTRADADNDGYCSATAANTCNGTTAAAGRRFPQNCIVGPDDCNDANPLGFTLRSVRADADNDGFCVGPTAQVCGGSTIAPGTLLAASCNTIDDCRDSNPNATSVCTLYISSQSHIKACGFGIPATQQLSFDWQCPTGFQALNSVFFRNNIQQVQISEPAIPSPLVIGTSGTTAVNFSCYSGTIGEDSFRLQVTCGAL